MSTKLKYEKFWVEDPCVLITNFCKFNPFVQLNQKHLGDSLNSYTRFVIVVAIVLFCATKENNYIYIALFLIVLIVIMYYSFKKDNFEEVNYESQNQQIINELLSQEKLPRRQSDYYNVNVSENNPLKNVPITDYNKEPTYFKSTASDSSTNKFVEGKIFQTADQWVFDRNTRQFYTTANTSVPNDQTGFANWLYGTENICKEGSIYMNRRGTPAQTQSCNGFNVATPTNFGNLNDYVPNEN